jgi:hypothetical protein
MSAMSVSDSSKTELDDEFIPLSIMPTSRLTDIMKVLSTRSPAVLNIDALLPPKEAGENVLKTILKQMPVSVTTFSLRFNHLSSNSIEELISWISSNNHLEVLYVMGSGIDEKSRTHLEQAWKKNLVNHR